MKHSIRKKFTLIFVGLFAVLVLAMLIFYSFFLLRFYRNEKIKQLRTAYETIDSSVVSVAAEGQDLLSILKDDYDQNAQDSESISMLRNLSERSNIDIVMMNSSGTLSAATSRESEWNQMKLKAYISFNEVFGDYEEPFFPILGDNPYEADNDDVQEQDAADNQLKPDGKHTPSIEVLERGDNYVIQLFNDRRSNTSYLECWGQFSDKDTYFLMTMPIASMEDGVSISRAFLISISAVMLIVGAIAVYLTAGLMTEPIINLANISKKVTNLDFSERYTGKQKDEIGVLGDSMNQMSERLEETIRELKEANAKLQEDIDAKTKIDEMRKEFIADVSHELKTPIAIIEGYAEGLVEGIADDKETRDYYSGIIMDEAGKMNKLVKQLTSLISYEFGDDQNDASDFNLTELVNSVLEAQKIRLNEAGAKLSTDMAEKAYVHADEFKIEEAFTNYLNNAINHLEGDRNIRVSLNAEGDSWRLAVYNDGTPIPEESKPKLWDKFYKVDKSRSRQYGGSGIGLSIVKAIVESHGGRYGVINHDSGVEFWLTLSQKQLDA